MAFSRTAFLSTRAQQLLKSILSYSLSTLSSYHVNMTSLPKHTLLSPTLSHVPANAMSLPFLSIRGASSEALFTASGIPRLPVPPLDQTLDKYLQVVRPLISVDDYARTHTAVEVFRSGAGPRLQTLLQERSEASDNWLQKWWLECAYLGFRLPVVVHSSPGVATIKQEFSTQNQLVSFCAKVVRSAVTFYLDVLEDRLPPDMMGSVSLDMSQYSQILATTRIPCKDIDNQRRSGREECRHILVLHQGRFFRVPVFTRGGQPASKEAISYQLEQVLLQSDTPCEHEVGLVTSLHRDKLVSVREELLSVPTNKQTLDQIETAIFTLCIDNPTPPIPTCDLSPLADPTDTVAARISLHGSGGSVHSGNRWFDSCVQLLVGKDGYYGMNYEHSTADAPPLIKLFDRTITASQEPNEIVASHEPLLVPPEELTWSLSPASKRDIFVARQELDSLVADTDLQAFSFREYGKEVPKSYHMSPDSYFQMALQLAYYKMHSRTPATYESGSTRKFYQGRTETIRSATTASAKFVQAMYGTHISNEKRAHLLRLAVESHRNYTIEAVNGQGVDRHLLGLKLIAKEKGIPLPEIFTDPAYSHSLHITLSTSQVPSVHKLALSFGAVVPDGYGVCYNPRENEFHVCVCTFKSCPTTSTAGFIRCLEESLMQMQHTMHLGQPAKL